MSAMMRQCPLGISHNWQDVGMTCNVVLLPLLVRNEVVCSQTWVCARRHSQLSPEKVSPVSLCKR